MPCRPSCSPAWRQTAGVQAVGGLHQLADVAIGARSARNRRTEARSSSCSALTPRIIYPAPFLLISVLTIATSIGDDQHVQRFYLVTAHPQRVDFQCLQAGDRDCQLADPGDDCRQRVQVGRARRRARPVSTGSARSSASIDRTSAASAGSTRRLVSRSSSTQMPPRPTASTGPKPDRRSRPLAPRRPSAHRRDKYLVPALMGFRRRRPPARSRPARPRRRTGSAARRRCRTCG